MNIGTSPKPAALLFGLSLFLTVGCEPEQAAPETPEATGPAVQLTQVSILDEGLDRPESAIYDVE